MPPTPAQVPFGGRFRNTRTATGFEPMPSKTQPDKMLPVTFGTHKKQFFYLAPSSLWSKPFGDPEQQQDSSPCQAKRGPTKCFPSPLEPIKNSYLAPSVRGWFRNHWRKSLGGRFRNTRTAAGFEPMPSKTQPDKMLPVTFWFRNHWRKSLGGRFRNTRTAAGFEPMPSKTQPDKMLPVTFGTHKKQLFCLAPSVRGWFRNHWRKSLGGRFRKLERQQDSSPCQAKCSPTKCFPSPLEPIKNSSFVWHPRCEPGSETIGASPVPKHSNGSRIRAHAKQNAARQNASRHLWNP